VNTTAAADPTYATWQTSRHNDLGASSNGDLTWNNNPGGRWVEPYAATVTPVPDLAELWDIGALTGNITIANPAHPGKGMRLGFVFRREANTTARTISWGSAFKLAGAFTPAATASAVSSITFECDGTNWYEMSRALNIA
jgi:hypothetical protein